MNDVKVKTKRRVEGLRFEVEEYHGRNIGNYGRVTGIQVVAYGKETGKRRKHFYHDDGYKTYMSACLKWSGYYDHHKTGISNLDTRRMEEDFSSASFLARQLNEADIQYGY